MGQLFLVGFCCACSGGEMTDSSGPACAPDTAQIDSMLVPLLRGDYDGFVGQLASCEGQPESYRHQMAMAYKQCFSKTPLSGFRVSRIEMPRDSVAEVFVLAETPQGREEILLRMVYTEGHGWQFR